MTPSPRIEADRLVLEPLRVEDADHMATVLADPQLYEFIGGGAPDAARLRELYARWIAGPAREGEAWHNWAVRLTGDGTLIGHVQSTIAEAGMKADVAWIVGTPWQGRGYATEAAIALVGWLREQGVATVTAHVHPRHRASARVADRAGFAPTELLEGGEIVWRWVANDDRSRET